MNILTSFASFANNFYCNMLGKCPEKLENTFFSPFNIYTALGMVLSGCEKNTKVEIEKVMQLCGSLNYTETHDSIRDLLERCSLAEVGVEMILGNKLFTTVHAGVKENFKQNLAGYYSAETEHVPFETDPEGCRKRINQWVSEKTKGKIEELLPFGSVAADTSIVVTATTYFKGEWQSAFPEFKSHDSDFHKLDGSKMTVKLMFTESSFNIITLPHLNSRAVKIPFKDPMFALLVILPDANDGLPNLLRSLSKGNTLSSIISSNDFEGTKLKLYLPRFKLKEGSSVSVKKILQGMGINDAFCPSSADFTGISESCRLCVSDVLHKAILEVDEKGAVAAAGTAIQISVMSIAIPIEHVPIFRVDHPFFISIVWNNSVPLFMGHITEPKED
ncbi:unnamed protein product [Trichobilharzia szidati]|nr:unnamed protein product [Trichobilharzia szidati]